MLAHSITAKYAASQAKQKINAIQKDIQTKKKVGQRQDNIGPP